MSCILFNPLVSEIHGETRHCRDCGELEADHYQPQHAIIESNFMQAPSLYEPQAYGELIGPAGELARVLSAKVGRMNAIRQSGSDRNLSARWVIAGNPGVGKSELGKMCALDLAGGERLAIESKSGLLVTIDVVKSWINALGMGSLFGNHQVKLIHEMDRIPPAAQDLLLDYLDQSKRSTDLAFIGTSNADTAALQERFETRLQYWDVAAPTQEQITALIMKWEINPNIASMIAAGCTGNVRQALLDLESHLDLQYSNNLINKLAA